MSLPANQVPPQSLEAEQSLLATCLLDEKARDQAVAELAPEDFYKTGHKKIASVIFQMHAAGEHIDIVTVYEKCRQIGIESAVGGASYISQLVDTAPVSHNVIDHAKIIREKADLRRIITSAHQMAEKCFAAGQKDVQQIIANAWEDFIATTGTSRRTDVNSMQMKNIVIEAIDQLEETCINRNRTIGVKSGFSDIDMMMHGFLPSDFIVIAARPGMGKTALITAIADHNAANDVPVALFSMEMSRKQISYRLMGARAKINSLKFRSGMISQEEWQRIVHVSGDISRLPLFIDDTGDMSIAQFRQRARTLFKLYGIKLIITDYLQLMRAFDDDRAADQNTEVSAISKAHKNAAKELGIPVIAVSQLSRKLEERSDKRPHLSDLRSSGQIEQDADAVLFLYRDSVYSNKEVRPDEAELAEVNIAKQRNGPTGRVYLGFEARSTRFYTIED